MKFKEYISENYKKRKAIIGQMTKIQDRLRMNPRHRDAHKDRAELLDLQRKLKRIK